MINLSRSRMPNTLLRAYNDVDNSPLEPIPLTRSNRQYFYKTNFILHENFVFSGLGTAYNNNQYAITDGSKIVGYLTDGVYLNLISVY